MNAPTTHEQLSQLNEDQTNRCKSLLDVAVAGFMKKNPSAQDITNFTTRVGESILASVLKNSEKNDSAKRDSRLKTVDGLAELHNVKFIHNRQLEQSESLHEFQKLGKNVHREVVTVYTQNATLGGETLAYVYRLDEKNNLFMVYATAFCRSDENFDPLIGKEESLKKFLTGDTLEVQVTHERLGPVKLAQLVNEYKANENAMLEVLRVKAASTQ